MSMEGNPNDSIKTEPGPATGYEPNGPTREVEERRESVALNREEYDIIMNFREAQQRRALGLDPSQFALPPSPVARAPTPAPAQVPVRAPIPQTVVNQPAIPGYRTVTIPEELARNIFGQISDREMEALEAGTARARTRS